MSATIDIHLPAGVVGARVFKPQHRGYLAEIARLAEEYPHPHSIFGKYEANHYVRILADRVRFSGEGWYGAAVSSSLAAIHLGVYGGGDGRGHTIFKLRHPLFEGSDGTLCLIHAIATARHAANRLHSGSKKLVVFISENEGGAREAAVSAGFILEGTLSDYYRLGERCLVLGYTEEGK